MANLYFVTGTDTEIGKTYCTARLAEFLLAGKRRVGVYKPVASGCDELSDGERYSVDADVLWQAASRPKTLADVCPQKFLTPVAPPEAAFREGRRVDQFKLVKGMLAWCNDTDNPVDDLLIEGAGGYFSPISKDWLNIDLAKIMRTRAMAAGHAFYVLLVAPDRLGVLHQVISTTRAAKADGLPVDGVILNRLDESLDPSCSSNHEDLMRWCDVPIVAETTGPQGKLAVHGGGKQLGLLA
ncbi:dethiobiotin synthase [Rhodopirellula halodulae]|uniref:dethiobiotin synthase n=1 Tax=Rhodopirellula halodulae TaxID=2894198 RepID=UPI001E43FC68|nr:dethiobiotin synthase [Rhodopirellula sp. JC737]MCC9658154.1 dethiobiotin synthase [Rhodopirellula sp. JC737]